MKANELTIGDWVRSPKNVDGDFYAGQVCEIKQGGEHYYCYIPGPDGNDSIRCDDLSPVPLTGEILEKNGFEQYGISRVMYIGKDLVIEIFLYTQPLIKIGSRCDGMLQVGFKWIVNWMPISYVHELQHLLRLFGIDNEIVI